MYFNNYTRIRFLNNTADLAGGAIYAGNQCLQNTPPCFFQWAYDYTRKHTKIYIEEIAQDIVYFDGNHAKIAGHAIIRWLSRQLFHRHKAVFQWQQKLLSFKGAVQSNFQLFKPYRTVTRHFRSIWRLCVYWYEQYRLLTKNCTSW